MNMTHFVHIIPKIKLTQIKSIYDHMYTTSLINKKYLDDLRLKNFISLIIWTFYLISYLYPCDQVYAKNGFSLAVSQNISSLNLIGVDNSAELGARIGYRYKTYQPYILIDYHANQFSIYQSNQSCETDNTICQSDLTQNLEFKLWTIGLGLKKLFSPVQVDHVNFYILTQAYIVLPQLWVNDASYESNGTSLGGTFALGIQYSFAHVFSVGAELGIHYIQGIQAQARKSQVSAQSDFINLSGDHIEASTWQLASQVVLEFIL
jgi:hypothetical protein